MVDVKSIRLGDKSFIGMRLYLPGYPLFFMISTKTIIASDSLDIRYFQKDLPVSVLLINDFLGFKDMCHSTICHQNQIATAHGVKTGMRLQEAIELCETDV